MPYDFLPHQFHNNCKISSCEHVRYARFAQKELKIIVSDSGREIESERCLRELERDMHTEREMQRERERAERKNDT